MQDLDRVRGINVLWMGVSANFGGTHRDFTIVVREASSHSGLQTQDPTWLAVHMQFSALHGRLCGYKKKAEALFAQNLTPPETHVSGRRAERLREHGSSRAPSPTMVSSFNLARMSVNSSPLNVFSSLCLRYQARL